MRTARRPFQCMSHLSVQPPQPRPHGILPLPTTAITMHSPTPPLQHGNPPSVQRVDAVSYLIILSAYCCAHLEQGPFPFESGCRPCLGILNHTPSPADSDRQAAPAHATRSHRSRLPATQTFRQGDHLDDLVFHPSLASSPYIDNNFFRLLHTGSPQALRVCHCGCPGGDDWEYMRACLRGVFNEGRHLCVYLAGCDASVPVKEIPGYVGDSRQADKVSILLPSP